MSSYLLQESGDRILLESGAAILLEDHVHWLSQWPLPDLLGCIVRFLGEQAADAFGDLSGDRIPPPVIVLAVSLLAEAIAHKVRTGADPRGWPRGILALRKNPE